MFGLRICLLVFLVFAIQVRSLNTYGSRAAPEYIRVAIDNNYPPYSFIDSSGTLSGILIDQWKLFEERTGIKVVIEAHAWSDARKLMDNGSVDVIDTIFYNPERAKIYDFTKPYVKIEVPIFFKKSISGIAGINSLKGSYVAAKMDDNVVKILEKHGVTDIVLFKNYEDIIRAAGENKINIFIMDKPPAMYYLYRMGLEDRFRYSKPVYTGEFHRAVRKGNFALLKAVENGFLRISPAEYNDIEDKWYGRTPVPTALRYMIYIIAGGVSLLLSLFLWNTLLRKNVKERTMELSRTVEELRKSENRLNSILLAVPDMFFLLDCDGVFLDYNCSNKNILFKDPQSFLGKRLNDVFPSDLCLRFDDALSRLFKTGECQTEEYSLEVKQQKLYFESRMVLCGTDKVLGVVRDITGRRIIEEYMIEASTRDSLTGLYNRNYFENNIVGQQLKEVECIGIIMCDLDGLKLVNDTLGHSMGDQYLVAVAHKLSDQFSSIGTVARIGGDEFAVIVPGISEDNFDEVCHGLRDGMPEYLEGAGTMPISVSIGTIYKKGANHNLIEMLREADRLMYREKLHRKQSIRSEVIQTLKKMLEARDFVTEGHAERMGNMIEDLAIAVRIPKREIPDLRLFAQFHDIGKVGIPDGILFKKGRLTSEEYETMKRHTEIGYHIALSSADLMPIAEWILKHHEAWDGSGYPLGIGGTDIPLQCRILSVVDTYDAMTNDRPYRKAMSKEDALAKIIKHRGVQFDPGIVDKFTVIVNSRKL